MYTTIWSFEFMPLLAGVRKLLVSKPCRTIHLTGTKGEIHGVMEDGFFVVRHPDARSGHEYSEVSVEVNVGGDQHVQREEGSSVINEEKVKKLILELEQKELIHDGTRKSLQKVATA